MIMRFIGDVHGKYNSYNTILKSSPYPTVQIGDMGVGFSNIHGEPQANPSYDLMISRNARFIRGNHDNPTVCKNHTQWIKDGTIEITEDKTKLMYVGGAWSTDASARIPNYSWWEHEELSHQEFDKVVFDYNTSTPDVMVTHDCPSSIAFKLFLEGTNNPVYPTRTAQAFEAMFSLHKPKLWIFGHWHTHRDEIINGTRFICLPELEIIDVEV